MTKLYASKELIDRAAACMSDFLDSRISESPIVLLSELAKSEPLLTNADREEAILRWLREAKVWPQDSSIGQPGYWVDGEHLEQAAILLRGGPASEPVPEVARCADCGEPTPVLLAHCCEQPKPSPEQRGPSEVEQLSRLERQSLVELRSRLDEVVKELTAAKNDRDEWRAMADPAVCRRQFPDGSVPGNAEECAIGWLNLYEGSRKEAEQLRKDRDEALEPLSVDVGVEVLVLQRHEAVEKIRELAERVEQAEAELTQEKAITATLERDISACHDKSRLRLNRAEKAEASADDKLRKLRTWIEDDDDGSGDGLVDRANLVDKIDTLIDNPPSDVASVDSKLPCGDKCATPIDCASGLYHKPNTCVKGFDDNPLRWLLCQYGDTCDEPSETDRDAAIAELCRRALREGGDQ